MPTPRSILRLLLLSLVLLAPLASRADGFIQTERLHRSKILTFAWEYSLPMQSLRSDFISSGSPAGVDVGARFGISRRISLGAAFTWNGMTQSGDPKKSLQALSLRGMAHWYFTNSEIQPYVGLFAGGAYMEVVQGAGPTQTGFAPLAGPELGFLFTVGDGVALILAARYEITFASIAVNDDPALPVLKNPSWVAIQAGVGFY
jgi:hypothetical protein